MDLMTKINFVYRVWRPKEFLKFSNISLRITSHSILKLYSDVSAIDNSMINTFFLDE